MLDQNEWREVANSTVDDCTAIFSMNRKLNMAKSASAGHPVFDETPYVKILIPGQMRNIVHRAVQDGDKKRWPSLWAAFEAGQKQALNGTRVEEWPYLTHEHIAQLRSINVFTVEQVATLSDEAQEALGPLAADLMMRAQSDLSGNVSSVEKKLRAQIEKLKTKIKGLKSEVKALSSERRQWKAGNVVTGD